jgi:hypothetical protein
MITPTVNYYAARGQLGSCAGRIEFAANRMSALQRGVGATQTKLLARSPPRGCWRVQARLAALSPAPENRKETDV